jgi:predicted enzyme related to lactoylglutathione lyase
MPGMPERTSYDPGTPSWVDLTTPDTDAAKRFYGELFGWQAADAGPAEETGGYAMFTLNGHNVAGIGPTMGEGQPPAWTTYFATADADATTEAAKAAGANALFGPMDVMEAGRMAVFLHPAAGFFGIWQAGDHTGAGLVNEPNTFAWNELLTRDVGAAKTFLETVFGLEPADQAFGGMTYTILNLGGKAVGGMMPMPPAIPAEAPAFWQTYFEVADCDAAVARVGELGGSVMMPPTDMEGVGRMAAVVDPQGATFSVIKSATPS